MSNDVDFRSSFAKKHNYACEGNVAIVTDYVKDLAFELAELANSAGCIRLAGILRLAAFVAQLSNTKATSEPREP